MILSGALPAAAATCLPADELGAMLASGANEKIVATGVLTGGKAGLTIWASEAGGFSVVVLKPDGTACMTLHGVGLAWNPPGVPG